MRTLSLIILVQAALVVVAIVGTLIVAGSLSSVVGADAWRFVLFAVFLIAGGSLGIFRLCRAWLVLSRHAEELSMGSVERKVPPCRFPLEAGRLAESLERMRISLEKLLERRGRRPSS